MITNGEGNVTSTVGHAFSAARFTQLQLAQIGWK